MTTEQRELARHALGFQKRVVGRLKSERVSYRNRFFTKPGCDGYESWADLAANGLAVHYPVDPEKEPNGYALFKLTRAGAESVLFAGESLDKEDFN